MQYLVVINKAGNNYGAYSPDVPGCISTGKTIEKTIKNMKEALDFHLDGEIMPEPKGLGYWNSVSNACEQEVYNSESILCFIEVKQNVHDKYM